TPWSFSLIKPGCHISKCAYSVAMDIKQEPEANEMVAGESLDKSIARLPEVERLCFCGRARRK
ncbi:unnamed protein product, partial [Candidula unifasciata]